MAKEIDNEMMFINAWVKLVHPTAKNYPRMRVGALPNGDVYQGVTRVFPDKILIENGTVLLIEGKLVPDSRAVGQLELYAREFPLTPEFEFAKDMPVRMILLTTLENKTIREFAESKGMEYVIFKPPEVDRILRQRLRIEE